LGVDGGDSVGGLSRAAGADGRIVDAWSKDILVYVWRRRRNEEQFEEEEDEVAHENEDKEGDDNDEEWDHKDEYEEEGEEESCAHSSGLKVAFSDIVRDEFVRR
jgi:hypothetical protein